MTDHIKINKDRFDLRIKERFNNKKLRVIEEELKEFGVELANNEPAKTE